MPPADELWAWAHVHFNQSLAASDGELVSPDMGAVLPRVQAILGQNPDLAYSRLVCPRRLDDNTGYHAFVVPTFETGRLAGLGLDPTLAPNATVFGLGPAYAGQPEPSVMPVYYRWYFRTGSQGDFEYLVPLLKPQPVDTPASARATWTSRIPARTFPASPTRSLAASCGSAARCRFPTHDLDTTSCEARQKYENWDQPYPQPFQTALAAFVNLADDYAAQTARSCQCRDRHSRHRRRSRSADHRAALRPLARADRAPADQARRHAGRRTITNWVHELNLDPRFRVPAGFGTDVDRRRMPKTYMDDAWQQIGDVLGANRKIRQLQLATEVARRCWHQRSLTPLADVERRARLRDDGAGRRPSAHGQDDRRLHPGAEPRSRRC